ncbi:S8 family peptidase [Mesorhizobium sp. L48C026A00]|uniref:S8 family peptidase n=1 Tax=Mesorhizobium sp. L48C026A00 TaxID=1287182 RepID=UPI000429EC7D|nr:S8 family peptidase [Mesorhizobium sp. L48C026A00]
MDATPFRPHRSGRTKKDPATIPDRAGHARALKANFAKIADRLAEHTPAQEEAGIPKNKQGVVITATGFGAQKLWVGEMKASSPGVSLLSVTSAYDDAPASAKLFVTRNSLETISNQIDKYSAFETRHSNVSSKKKPTRFQLFESTSEFKPALLEDVWTGPIDDMPKRKSESVETWIRSDRATYFYRVAERLGISTIGNPTKFTDSIVVDMTLNAVQMQALLDSTGAVIEFRPSSHFVHDYRRGDGDARKAISNAVAQRIVPAPAGAPRTVILDSGVYAANPLLRASISPANLKTVDADWGTDDKSGHGTAMAGVALFPNLEAAATSRAPIVLTTALESVKVFRPLSSTNLIVPRDAIQEAVKLVERDSGVERVFSLSATIPGEDESGRQSATSAAVDKLAWNDGVRSRLFCVAAGNVPLSRETPYQVAHYDGRNADFPVQSPGQAVNALSVGAYTDKDISVGTPVAPKGDLCPVSRTSQKWDNKYRTSNKPDVVFEGGNHIFDPGKKTSRGSADTRVLTTGRAAGEELDLTGETSAATAGVAGLATRLLSRYPQMRSESVRGLIVNGASWTPAMQRQAEGGSEERKRVLDTFGWGVPDERLIQESDSNSLTLVIEDEITPFETRDGRCGLKEMKYFDLPWPKRELERIGNAEVRLACTLSYFIEPDPLADKRARKDRYASHRLRFRFNQPDDTATTAQSRLNQLVELDDDEIEVPNLDDGRWFMDWRRSDIGTVHNNIWTGPAHELAVRGGVCVYPVKGWWADRSSPECRRSTPFSLVISLRTAHADVDLYTEAMANVPAHAIIVSTNV